MGNTPTKETSFRNAAASGDVQFVRQCMQTDDRERLLSATTGYLNGRKTVLHLAAKHGNAEVIASVLGPLVDAVTEEIVDGVYPGKATKLLGKVANQQDGRGRTPLLTACFCGHWDCAELLLEAGANAFAADKDGNGVLHLAAINGHAQLVQQLLEKAEAQAITGRLAAAVNLSGFTALHYAAWSGSAEVVRLLLTAGVDQMQCNWEEYDRWLIVPTSSTPLHVAALHHHSGACLALLQSFALQLREWLPGDPVPVDPRTRRDSKGELPVDLAICTGLPPSSQLALCLQPSIDVLSVFGAQQLDGMQRRGPPPLKLIAAEALRTDLLHKLGNLQGQQQLLLHQKEIEKQLRRQQQQQQRRQDEQQGVHSSNSSWQRWWSRNSIDQQHAATVAAADTAGGKQHRHASGSRHSKLWGAPADGVGSSSSRAEISPSDSVLPKFDDNIDDNHHAELVHRLHRTPSITLGAVQYAKTSPDNSMTAMAGHVQHGERQHLSSSSSSNVSGEQLTAPAGEDVTLDPAAAAAAATKLATDGDINASPAASAANIAADDCSQSSAAAEEVDDARSHRPLATASITLGYLDRVWTLDKMQQQQQQQQQHEGSVAATAASSVAAPRTPGLTVLQGSNLNSSSNSSSSSPIGDTSLGEIEAIEHDMGPQQQQQLQSGPAAADTSLSVHMSGNSRDSRSDSPSLHGIAAPSTPAITADTTFQNINDPIHRATGSTSAFVLINGPCQSRFGQQQDGMTTTTSSSSSSSINSSTGSSSAGESAALHSKQDNFQQQQQLQQTQQRCLQTSSITLAELDDSNNRGGVLASSGEAKININSSSSNHGRGPRIMRRGANGPGTPQQLLERAGIKGKSWEQFMTPRSWLLYQQQREGGTLRLQQQQKGSTPQDHLATSSTAGSTPGSTAAAGQVGEGWATGSSSSGGASAFAARRAVLLSNQHRSPHRRSFELPGASAGMSAVLGANRQHVSRMLREAGAVDPKTLYKTLSGKQGSLAVATSLAGALPGCVSEKLVQVVDVSRSINHGPLLAVSGSNPVSNAAVFGSSTAAGEVADGVGSVGSSHGEVCAICADKAPAVGLASCGHMLCFECTKCIVGEGIGCRPPLCPFCRRNIIGFGLVAAASGGL